MNSSIEGASAVGFTEGHPSGNSENNHSSCMFVHVKGKMQTG